MPEPILLWSIQRFANEDGELVEVEVSPDLAEAIRDLDEGMRLREQRHKKRHVTFTDLTKRKRRPGEKASGVNPNGVDEARGKKRIRERKAPVGNPWEGPRFTFLWFLGESRRWDNGLLKKGRCRFCKGLELPQIAYCLACDRCGMDLLIPRPTPADRARLEKAMGRPKDDGLKGGKG